MNWLIRLGEWWESRRVLRKPDMEIILNLSRAYADVVKISLDALESKILLVKDSQQIPTELIKEIKLINLRLNQMELFVGLKREPKPEHVPGAAKIS